MEEKDVILYWILSSSLSSLSPSSFFFFLLVAAWVCPGRSALQSAEQRCQVLLPSSTLISTYYQLVRPTLCKRPWIQSQHLPGVLSFASASYIALESSSLPMQICTWRHGSQTSPTSGHVPKSSFLTPAVRQATTRDLPNSEQNSLAATGKGFTKPIPG